MNQERKGAPQRLLVYRAHNLVLWPWVYVCVSVCVRMCALPAVSYRAHNYLLQLCPSSDLVLPSSLGDPIKQGQLWQLSPCVSSDHL